MAFGLGWPSNETLSSPGARRPRLLYRGDAALVLQAANKTRVWLYSMYDVIWTQVIEIHQCGEGAWKVVGNRSCTWFVFSREAFRSTKNEFGANGLSVN